MTRLARRRVSPIKLWSLDGHSAYLYRSILLLVFKTPGTRSLYNQPLTNVSGKARMDEKSWPAIGVPASIDQVDLRVLRLRQPTDELEKGVNYFMTQSSSTAIFIPSSLDFIHVHNYFRKHANSSSPPKRPSSPPPSAFTSIDTKGPRHPEHAVLRALDHPRFLSGFLSYPFLDDGVDEADVFRLEKILGTHGDRGAFVQQ
ncbi:hypothetical protein BV22DRAFT_1122978 [Leucogyrophana mollusca]|uniref:Uncharacterized protein n=1 Tax=Leucogyrophana mollusca TaxID=85980 RepID=A0ACB8B4E3_9AGAM|nr:hypothetical protein BV22DRAFT_1122978 [Leucogyrophana mollusca]